MQKHTSDIVPRFDNWIVKSRQGKILATRESHEKLDYPPEALIVTRLPPSATPGEATIECVLQARHKPILFHSLSQQPRARENQNKTYLIKQTSRTGLGMFAARDISAGELITAELPFIIFPEEMPAEPVLQLASRRMLQPDRDAFLSLDNSYLQDRASGLISGIVKTNSICYDRLESYNCVLRDISRVNHSCVPNAKLITNASTPGVFSLHAGKDIPANNEIVRSYFNSSVYLKNAERQIALSGYHFSCGCDICNLSLAGIEEYDTFFEKINKTTAVVESELQEMITNKEQNLSRLIRLFMMITDITTDITSRCCTMNATYDNAARSFRRLNYLYLNNWNYDMVLDIN